jgi:antitoxin FitA
MSKTFVLKGVSDEIHQQLELRAKANRRSVNAEAIACLAAALLPRKTTALEHVAAARAIREALGPFVFEPKDILSRRRER